MGRGGRTDSGGAGLRGSVSTLDNWEPSHSSWEKSESPNAITYKALGQVLTNRDGNWRLSGQINKKELENILSSGDWLKTEGLSGTDAYLRGEDEEIVQDHFGGFWHLRVNLTEEEAREVGEAGPQHNLFGRYDESTVSSEAAGHGKTMARAIAEEKARYQDALNSIPGRGGAGARDTRLQERALRSLHEKRLREIMMSGSESPSLRQEEVSFLASQFHDDWRAGRRQPDGSYEPRIKETKDEAWIEAHGTHEVDIANTSYDDLPSDWQAENLAAAEAAQKAVESSATIEEAAAVIHDEWLARNGEWAPEEQKVPYDQLSEEEKAKDRDQALALLEASGRFVAGEDGTIIPTRSDLVPSVNNLDENKIVTCGKVYTRSREYPPPGADGSSRVISVKDLDTVWRDEEGQEISKAALEIKISSDPSSHYAGKDFPPLSSLVPNAYRPAKDAETIIAGDKKYHYRRRPPEGVDSVTSAKDMETFWVLDNGQEFSASEMEEIIRSNANSRYLLS